MPKRTHHIVFDLKYQLVWITKYRKSLLLGFIEKRVKELFYEIAEEHDFEILAIELMPDHMHLFASAAPKWLPGKIVSIFKTITSKIIFEEFPQVKKKLWGSHLWNAGYYFASVGGQSHRRNGQKVYQASATDKLRLVTFQKSPDRKIRAIYFVVFGDFTFFRPEGFKLDLVNIPQLFLRGLM